MWREKSCRSEHNETQTAVFSFSSRCTFKTLFKQANPNRAEPTNQETELSNSAHYWSPAFTVILLTQAVVVENWNENMPLFVVILKKKTKQNVTNNMFNVLLNNDINNVFQKIYIDLFLLYKITEAKNCWKNIYYFIFLKRKS